MISLRHLAGLPLASTRRWRAYYYLGYDVVPACNESEYPSDTNASKEVS